MKLKAYKNGIYGFYCVGCKAEHKMFTQDTNHSGAKWQFNGDLEKPTFSPSLLIRSGHYIDGNMNCWCKYHKEHPEEVNAPKCSVCHSFIVDGKIQFLSDCTHEFAGKTVEIPDVKH